MPRTKELYLYDDSRQVVIGRFHEFPRPSGKPTRKDLCTYEKLKYKETSRGRKQRSEVEKDAFIRKLFDEKLEELKKEIQRAEEAQLEAKEKESPMIKEVMQEWLAHIKSVRSKGTFSAYENAKDYYLEILGNHRLSEYQHHFNDDLITGMQKKMFSPVTIRKHLVALSGFFKWAYQNRFYDGRIIKLSSPQITKKQPRVYDAESIKKLERYIWQKYEVEKSKYRKHCYLNHHRILVMLICTGMRRSECFALKLENILLSDRVIRLRDVEELSVRVKGREEQIIPISNSLADYLKEDFSQRGNKDLYFLDSGQGTPHFSSPDKLTQSMARHCKKIGISGEAKVLHGFRSTLITQVVAHYGVAVGQQIARHKDIQTTMGYVNASSLPVKQALDGLQLL